MNTYNSFALVELALQAPRPIICIVKDVHEAQQLKREIPCFVADRSLELLVFPDWETLPYDHFSPPEEISGERIRTLYQLPHFDKGIVILPIQTLLYYVTPKHHIESHTFIFKVGMTINPQLLRAQLHDNGYFGVTQVMQPGEYAFRGSVCDIFPMGSKTPVRLDLFDHQIDTLRIFNPVTQLTEGIIDRFELLPAHEFSLEDSAISCFRSSWREVFEGDPSLCSVYRDVTEGTPPAGIEYYIPLFFNEMNVLCDYFPKNALIVHTRPLESSAQAFWKEIRSRYEQRCHDIRHPILAPERLFLLTDQVFAHLKAFQKISLPDNLRGTSIPDITLSANAPYPLKKLEDFLLTVEGRVLFCTESTGRQASLSELLSTIGIQPKVFRDWRAFAGDIQQYRWGICVAPLDESFWLVDRGLIFISEPDLYGEQVMQHRARRKRQIDPFEAIHHLSALKPGAAIVHITYGVGRYLGLKKLPIGEIDAEYVCLEYAEGAKLYVPVSSLHLISRYSSLDLESVPLNKLGTEQWEKTKKKAQEKIKDVAAELLDIYARRKAQLGVPYPIPAEDYATFKISFGFEETPDQATCIEQVLSDLSSPAPMDRLICGDVGFGKTEVALRAAFIVAHSGKQVAVLVPTTLLAQQHFETFRNRFAAWPFQVAALSRFQNTSEQKQILEKLDRGQIDIVIGTHKLLQGSIHFKDLGLLIVDEEHRFGVKQKEKLKSLRANVDILSMTATPIPRTLNMAMSTIRDFSIIATPPARRLPIKTFVREYDALLIREAVLRELMRGGQVYYLHNDVYSIEETANKLREIIPEARIVVAHGQMHERTLEKVMDDFYHQRFNVLLCSTIIETGIDVPTANTIILERADKLGLAQLHQLRGRVGRSYHQAYAYCLTPPLKQVTVDAQKRLEALAANEHLGAGFSIATHDLEIRGAGALLGEEQSGHIESIGYSLYIDLLEKTVHALKSGKKANWLNALDTGPEIDCHLSALLPEEYLPDVQARLILYKRIANARSYDGLRELQVEMIDRFGLLPLTAKNLFKLAELKINCLSLQIKKIDFGPQGGYIEFNHSTPVEPATLIRMIQLAPRYYKLQNNQLRLLQTLPLPEERLKALYDIIGQL